MDDIYNSKILEFAGNIGRAGSLPDADAVSEKHSKLCGSRVRVYVKVDNLFDATYYDSGWQALGRTGVAGVSVGF